MKQQVDPPPEYKRALFVASRGLDWALEQERDRRHFAVFIRQFRPDSRGTSTITIPTEETGTFVEADRIAEAERIAKTSPRDVDSLVIGCWGQQELEGRRMRGLHLVAHVREAESGFHFFQEIRTGWFRRGPVIAGTPIYCSRVDPILDKRPRRTTTDETTGIFWPNAVAREESAQAVELFATIPALRDYWEGLLAASWLSVLPEMEHAALRARLMKAHANNPATIHEGLAAIDAEDVLMVEPDMDGDGGSVTFLGNAYRIASRGAVRLERIQSRVVDRDDEEREPEDVDDILVEISFELRGRTVRLDMKHDEPLEPVREAVNGILAEDGEPCRFYHVPAPNGHIGFIFMPPDVYAAATTRGLLPLN